MLVACLSCGLPGSKPVLEGKGNPGHSLHTGCFCSTMINRVKSFLLHRKIFIYIHMFSSLNYNSRPVATASTPATAVLVSRKTAAVISSQTAPTSAMSWIAMWLMCPRGTRPPFLLPRFHWDLFLSSFLSASSPSESLTWWHSRWWWTPSSPSSGTTPG